MPIYEFICEQCQNCFETITTSSRDSEPVTCARCGSRQVRKTISAPCARVSSGGSATAMPSAPAAGGCSSRSGFS